MSTPPLRTRSRDTVKYESYEVEPGEIYSARVMFGARYGLRVVVIVDHDDGSGNGFVVRITDRDDERREGVAVEFVRALIEMFGVEYLDELTGRRAYSLYEDGLIVGVALDEPDGEKFILVEDWRKIPASEGSVEAS